MLLQQVRRTVPQVVVVARAAQVAADAVEIPHR
jgi:hypothetical protein